MGSVIWVTWGAGVCGSWGLGLVQWIRECRGGCEGLGSGIWGAEVGSEITWDLGVRKKGERMVKEGPSLI